MGLLITLFLITGNTFSSVQRSGPQDRNFGTIEIWMLGCIIFMSFAIIEYAIILLKMKNEHDNGCELEYKNHKKMNKKCCKNNEFKELDRWCLILIPLLFLAFNLVFWCSVYKIDDFPAKSTSSANTLTSSVFKWGSDGLVSQVTNQPQGGVVETDQAENDQLQNGSVETPAATTTASSQTTSTATSTPTSTIPTTTPGPISSGKYTIVTY